MKLSLIHFVLAAALATWQCGGSDGSSQSATAPSPAPTPAPAPAPASVVTVSIVGTIGNGSYVPNPVAISGSDQVVFRNDDTVLHRIVMDNGSVDFGSLAPGTSSPGRAVGNGNFHCTLHPSMVGSIGGTTPPTPPAGSGDGY